MGWLLFGATQIAVTAVAIGALKRSGVIRCVERREGIGARAPAGGIAPRRPPPAAGAHGTRPRDAAQRARANPAPLILQRRRAAHRQPDAPLSL
jgi:hypothetical protein